MKRPTAKGPAPSPLLSARVALLRTNPFVAAAVLLVLAVAGSLWWTLHATWQLEHEDEILAANAARAARTQAQAGLPPPAAVVPAPAPQVDNLERFYAALGPRRDAELEVKTLFGLAERNGLLLRQGEYKTGYDRNAHVVTYQMNLPVKGSYGAIWQFALGALQAIPFASLDDISFRRDAIGDAAVEARVRLTLYLRSDAPRDDARRSDAPRDGERPGTAGGSP